MCVRWHDRVYACPNFRHRCQASYELLDLLFQTLSRPVSSASRPGCLCGLHWPPRARCPLLTPPPPHTHTRQGLSPEDALSAWAWVRAHFLLCFSLGAMWHLRGGEAGGHQATGQRTGDSEMLTVPLVHPTQPGQIPSKALAGAPSYTTSWGLMPSCVRLGRQGLGRRGGGGSYGGPTVRGGGGRAGAA